MRQNQRSQRPLAALILKWLGDGHARYVGVAGIVGNWSFRPDYGGQRPWACKLRGNLSSDLLQVRSCHRKLRA